MTNKTPLRIKNEPIQKVGTLLGWILLGEQIGGTFWIGSFLILSGVLLVIKEKEKEVKS